MSQPAIAIAPNVSTDFRKCSPDAIRVRRVEATDAASSYLVGLLCDYAHPSEDSGSTFSRPLTFQLRDALEADGATRFRLLRGLGIMSSTRSGSSAATSRGAGPTAAM